MAAMSALVLTIGLICALSSFHLAEAMQRCDYPRIDFECERVGVKKDVWQKFDLTLIKLDGECKEHVKYCVNDADGDQVQAVKAFQNYKPRPPRGSRPPRKTSG